jgi:hypothetical protein
MAGSPRIRTSSSNNLGLKLAESGLAALEFTSRTAAGDRTERPIFDQPLKGALARCLSGKGQITHNGAKLSH